MADPGLDDADAQGYRWETEYERTWEVLQEDATGSLTASVQDVVLGMKRRRLLEKKPNLRLGMMRHVFVIMDMSDSMKDQDFKPNRAFCVIKLLEYFVGEFFDQNPIGQIGFITTKNKRAERMTELSGNAKKHLAALNLLRTNDLSGEPSLQNSLELAAETLRNIPSHASREIIVVMGSLTSCDPGNIFDTARMLRECNIRCSVIGLSAEVSICRNLAKDTVGEYSVALDESHLKDVMMAQVFPPPVSANSDSFLIKMGFPQQKAHERLDEYSFCICHLDQLNSSLYGKPGYFCPVCISKYCELPVECKVCGLTLVSAPHLARSYHHLFPVEAFQELSSEQLRAFTSRTCFGCMAKNEEEKSHWFQCKSCKNIFCIDCDLFVHETLHSCPGCASSPVKPE
ncbi:general transcription factor IIH subunit 2-like [Paramacrobiotus metropolitanus]|uniref:general transcription factor IIH subunit 2-like n=1 Tax=Paramacrobiotus metropolitanus TaxID=2943436 RepID=UPI0024460B14|nr:general transcription factor IIH subunit 2-like [Paramacrobiotus metropolitanus]